MVVLVWMDALVLQLHWRTVGLLVLVVVALTEWHNNTTPALAAAVLALLLSLLSLLMMARSLCGMIVCALASSLLQVAMAERQKRLVMAGELVHVFVVCSE